MSNIKLFGSKQVRSHWNEVEEKWYFVVEDVVSILTDSKDAKQYIKRMRQRDEELAKGWVQIVPTLTIDTPGGKQRMSCSDVKGIFRIIQSIPSPKTEPFKRWLAQVGSERLLLLCIHKILKGSFKIKRQLVKEGKLQVMRERLWN